MHIYYCLILGKELKEFNINGNISFKVVNKYTKTKGYVINGNFYQ